MYIDLIVFDKLRTVLTKLVISIFWQFRFLMDLVTLKWDLYDGENRTYENSTETLNFQPSIFKSVYCLMREKRKKKSSPVKFIFWQMLSFVKTVLNCLVCCSYTWSPTIDLYLPCRRFFIVKYIYTLIIFSSFFKNLFYSKNCINCSAFFTESTLFFA